MYPKTIDKFNKTITFVIDEEHPIIIDLDDNIKEIILKPKGSRLKNKIWIYDEKLGLYYTLNFNNSRIYLVEYISQKGFNSGEFYFKNGNRFDYRVENISFEFKKHKMLDEINEKYTIIEQYEGHYVKNGKTANKEKNPYWKVQDKLTNEIFYLIFCETNYLTKISSKDINKVLFVPNAKNNPPTWYMMKNGYIATHIPNSVLYLHAHIMDYHGNGSLLSVDHINQDKLDNRNTNLRLATQSEQNHNTGKRVRKHNAQKIPEELNGITLPKFVTYNKEKMTTKSTVYYREFFRIEKHPKLDKTWNSTKSVNVSLFDKLKQTKERLEELEKGIIEKTVEKKYPNHVYITKDKRTGKNVFIFDRRTDDGRQNLKFSINEKRCDIQVNYDVFKDRVKTKYDYQLEDFTF